MSSRIRDRDAPTPKQPRGIGVTALIERDELIGLPFWPAHQPIREAFLRGPGMPVVQ